MVSDFLKLIVLLGLVHACAKLDANHNERDNEKSEESKTVDTSDSTSQMAPPAVLSGAYLDVQEERSNPNQTIVSASFMRFGKSILGEILALGGSVEWHLFVNGVSVPSAKTSLQLMNSGSGSPDKTWTLDVSNFGLSPDVSVTVSVLLPGMEPIVVKENGAAKRTNFPAANTNSAVIPQSVCSATNVNFMNGTVTGGFAKVLEIAGPAALWGTHELGEECSSDWKPFGTLCDEGTYINSRTHSFKSNRNSGATWYSGGGLSGAIVVDLGREVAFNELRVFQMFSDGKTTEISFFSHPSTTDAPLASDSGWLAVGESLHTSAGSTLDSGTTVTDPSVLNVSTRVKTRFLKVVAINNGEYASPTYTEIRSIKMFCHD